MSETPEVSEIKEKPFAEEDKIQLFLAYLGLFSLIPFFMFREKKDDPQKEFVYWHAAQGLSLGILWAAVYVVATICWIIPVIGWILGCLLYLVGLGGWVLMIMGWVKAFKGEKWKMPLVSQIAEKVY